jgi:Arc/MetJ family transcription regulator
MVSYVKTTIELPDSLLRAVQQIVRERHTTMRAFVEASLRSAVASARAQRASFKLRDASVDGHGLRPDVQRSSWAEIRDLSHGNRA